MPKISQSVKDTMKQKGYVTVQDACKLARYPESTVYGWIKDGSIEHQRVSNSVFIKLSALKEKLGPLLDDVAAFAPSKPAKKAAK